jgi:hypothetical protein
LEKLRFTFIASNIHAIGTPCWALLPLWRAANEMDVGGGTTRGAYRPHNPRASPLYRCVIQHAGELRRTGRLRRPVGDEVIKRFTECGDPRHGFAHLPR